MADPLSSIVTILTNDWTAGNTGGVTPTIVKYTDQKTADFGSSTNWILVHRSRPNFAPAGIGADAGKNEDDKMNIDIRVLGRDQEAQFYLVKEEVLRILHANKVNPDSDYTVLEYDGDGQDLSDQGRNLWRLNIPCQLKNYNKVRT